MYFIKHLFRATFTEISYRVRLFDPPKLRLFLSLWDSRRNLHPHILQTPLSLAIMLQLGEG